LRELVRRHLDNRDIRARITADHGGLQFAAILQHHGDLARILDHMRVGDDVSELGVDNDAGSRAFKFAFAGLGAVRAKETAKERIVKQRIALPGFAHHALDANADHRRRDAFDHRRERWQRRAVDHGGHGLLLCERHGSADTCNAQAEQQA